MKFKIIGVLILLFFLCGCGGGTRLDVKQGELLIVNKFSEFLRGDLDDYTTGREVKDLLYKGDTIAIGTTLRDRFGELFAYDGQCYYANPDDGKAHEANIGKDDRLPFLLASRVETKEGQMFDKVRGDIRNWIFLKMKEMGVSIAAVKVKGEFGKVRLAVTRRVPRGGTKFLKSGTNFVRYEFNGLDSGKDFEMVGFGILNREDRKLASLPEFPVRLCARSKDNAYSGFVVYAYAKNASVVIYPLKRYTLRNITF
jgi:alpha-acetolactate decarboxylase